MTSIFITVPWFDPAYKAGGPVQSIINMVNELHEGIEYKIFCSDTDLNNEPIIGLKTDQWIRYNDHTEVWYASKNNRSNVVVQQIERSKPDILYIVGLFSWHFNIVPVFFCKAAKKILSVRGMLHSGALTQKKLKKQFFIRAFKISGLHKKLSFHATDAEEEQQIYNNLSPAVKVSVASNFPRLIGMGKFPVKEQGLLRIVCIALISPMKNYLLVLQALALVKERVVYDIYGPVKELNYWHQCADQIKLLPDNIEVRYHRDLPPSQVPAKLQEHDVFVMPSKSENFGHSLVEALSAGLPVITSKKTPWNDLEAAKAGINVEETPEAIAAAISSFATMDEQTLQQWRNGAVEYITTQVDIASIRADYNKMFSISL